MAEYEQKPNTGIAFTNDYKKEDRHPDYRGNGNFNGEFFEFGIWEKAGPKGKYLSISFSEPYVKKDTQPSQSGYEKAKAQADSLRDTTDYDTPVDLSQIPF